jgi:hypothetical protein
MPASNVKDAGGQALGYFYFEEIKPLVLPDGEASGAGFCLLS